MRRWNLGVAVLVLGMATGCSAAQTNPQPADTATEGAAVQETSTEETSNEETRQEETSGQDKSEQDGGDASENASDVENASNAEDAQDAAGEEEAEEAKEEQKDTATTELLETVDGIYALTAYYPEVNGVHLQDPERGASVRTKFISLDSGLSYDGESEADIYPTADGGVLLTSWVIDDGDNNYDNDREVEAVEVYGLSENGYQAGSYKKKYRHLDAEGELVEEGYVGRFRAGVSDYMTLDAPMQKVINKTGVISASFYATIFQTEQDKKDVVVLNRRGEELLRIRNRKTDYVVCSYDVDHGIFSVADQTEGKTKLYKVLGE